MNVSPWLFGCLLCCPTVAQATDWVSIQVATTQSARSIQPAVTYDPGRSVAEFNQRQTTGDPSAYLLVSVELPKSELTLRKITNRPIRFVTSHGEFEGKVTAAFLRSSSSDKVTLHARVNNRLDQAHEWILKPGTTGTLSILP